ncbi:endolytic transglycosylase MltG [Bifidobacterium sp. ESL0745]|uniref:endolytic transglycosylase MltG n=1 Tax=Bifidobacterium sp. ESL0745 TaxID=2983226 RepID=UPI0023F97F7D|nr:endolytic transglycosylase MltG [Bifidobacterium sp. ESL0745]MDF7665152.1 endolytic transglycosylase MltG [Bifidobacterium sp. ESL0745]
MPEDFNELFDTNAEWVGTDDQPSSEPPKPPKSRHEMRERRLVKQRQRRQHLIIAAIVAVVIVIVGCGGFFGIRAVARHFGGDDSKSVSTDYPGPGTGKVWFTIDTGEGVASIAKNLVKANVVKNADTFASTVSANNSTLYPGMYELKKHMTSVDAVKILSDKTKATGFLEVKSGERSADVIAQAAQLSGIDQAQFDAVVNGGGQGILPPEAGGKFEGWLEPGIYDVKKKGSTAASILKQIVDKRVAKLNDLKVPAGPERETILNMASIAESEVNRPEYYGKVVRVILNRLAQGMALGMDSTVAYGANVKPSQLTNAMLNDPADHYNTRINKGLPPTPISSPGDDAINAAMAPTPGNWLYFVTTNLQTGETKFVATEAEFNQIRQEYKTQNPGAN